LGDRYGIDKAQHNGENGASDSDHGSQHTAFGALLLGNMEDRSSRHRRRSVGIPDELKALCRENTDRFRILAGIASVERIFSGRPRSSFGHLGDSIVRRAGCNYLANHRRANSRPIAQEEPAAADAGPGSRSTANGGQRIRRWELENCW
jgi:hypothetical protein